MILVLLLGNLVIAISGVALDAAENRAGPLGDTNAFMYLSYIENAHVWATDITLGCIRAMITGKKRLRSL